MGLGRDIIKGVEVEGFETTDPKYAGGMFEDILVRVWVDIEHGWPVMIEMDTSMASPVGDGLVKLHAVMDDYQWNPDLDPSEFQPAIPDDYTEMACMKIPAMDAQSAINGLRLFARFTGHYPKAINPMSMMNELMQSFKELLAQVKDIEKEIKNTDEQITPEQKLERFEIHLREYLENSLGDALPENVIDGLIDEAVDRARQKMDIPDNSKKINGNAQQDDKQKMNAALQESMNLFMPVQGLFMFNLKMNQENRDPRYYGAVVTPEDADEILYAWRRDDGDYDAIYGDLTTGVVNCEQLPPVPAAITEPADDSTPAPLNETSLTP